MTKLHNFNIRDHPILHLEPHKINVCYNVMLWRLTPLSTIFQLYRGGKFYSWRKPDYPEKTNMSQGSDKLITLYHRNKQN